MHLYDSYGGGGQHYNRHDKNRIEINKILSPTSRKIKNLSSSFTTSDGPNNSTIINLADIGIPYDSHYTSRIVLPADAKDFLLYYGPIYDATFLLIKVTYNGNYDYPMEDDFDPLYNCNHQQFRDEENNYNITYYYEGNSGKTYPINRLLILNGSLNNKIGKIYLNNPLDYDVVLDVFQTNMSGRVPLPPSTGKTITNLYYNDIITNQVDCGTISGTTTTTTTSGTTTSTTTSGITTTTTTTSGPPKKLMTITKSFDGEYYKYTATGETLGLFDYYKNNEWIFAGEDSNFVEFTDLTGIANIRFYFELNENYYGALKTDWIVPLDHNNGFYYVEITADGTVVSPPTTTTTTSISGLTSTTTTTTITGITNMIGSTAFIINEYSSAIPTGYTLTSYIVPYDTINSFQKDISIDIIYLDTITTYYTLIFLTEFDCNQAFARMSFVYESYLDDSCRYLTEDAVYKNDIIVDCSY